MRTRFTRTIAIVSTLVVAGLGLSACVSDGYDPYPRYGYNGGYGYNDGHRHDHRWEGRRWVDRDHDGRRDWGETRRR